MYESPNMKATSHRRLRICCAITAMVILVLAATLVVLYFTLLKPKRPQVIATPVSLEHIEIGVFPTIELHLTLGLDVYIKNRNYAGFKYENSSASIYYRGGFVGQAPIEAGMIPARATQNVSTSVDIMVEKLVDNPFFLTDVASGFLNLTSASSMEGKVIFLKIFKLHAKTWISCDVTVSIVTKTSTSTCNSVINI